ncbi:MAG: rod shape-determining protein MreD, partial [Pseudomonadota bacterium]|nr:rod shape-determining protein MreD [Pseudomonadota bacterium]
RAMLGRPFYILWFGFLAIISAALGLTWLLASLLQTHLIPPLGIGLQVVMTLAMFPFLVWLLVRIHRYIVTT